MRTDYTIVNFDMLVQSASKQFALIAVQIVPGITQMEECSTSNWIHTELRLTFHAGFSEAEHSTICKYISSAVNFSALICRTVS